MEIFMIVFALVVIVLAGLLVFSLKAKKDQRINELVDEVKRSNEFSQKEVGQIKNELSDRVAILNQSVIEILQKTNQESSSRFEASNRIFGDLKASISKIDESNRNIMTLGSSIHDLQNILKAPKLRGNLGETLLEDLLSQIFPKTFYSTQHSFRKNNTMVDAIIRLKEGIVPIDAKFPLEHFNKMLKAADNKEAADEKKKLIKMVKLHISSIRDKYIVPEEGTLDFAIMYIPAENVYYETIIRDDNYGDDNSLLKYAISKKVIPVSPNTFFAYLQTLLFGLKGMKIEKEAQVIMKNLAKVEADISKFDEKFQILGKNIDKVTSSYSASKDRWDFLNQRVQKAISGDNHIKSASEMQKPTDDTSATV